MKYMKEITKYLILLLLSANLYGQLTELERKTITEALNYTGDKSAVKKLIITDSIAGSDYSDSSEWSKFLDLDKTFPNIEAVEIWTGQNMPPAYSVYRPDLFPNMPDFLTARRSMFCFDSYLSGGMFNDSIYWAYGSKWLKEFSAPNIKNIGDIAFRYCANLISVSAESAIEIDDYSFSYCENLISVSFASAIKIGQYAFTDCFSLTSLNFPELTIICRGSFSSCRAIVSLNLPKVTLIGIEEEYFVDGAFSGCYALTSVDIPNLKIIGNGYGAFEGCTSLTSVSFSTDLEEGAVTSFGSGIFKNVPTNNADLILGQYVTPKPDITNNTWLNYPWKNINVLGIKENEEVDDIFYIGNNTYFIDNALELELYDIIGRKIKSFYNQDIIDLNEFTGIYFLRYYKNNKIKTKKIIIY